MALAHELPIYKHGCALLALALEVQTQLPRDYKRALGDRIFNLCTQMLEDMAMANACRGAARVEQLDALLVHVRAVTALLRVGHETRAHNHHLIPHALWGKATQALDAIGAQAGGWRNSALRDDTKKAPAA